MLSILKLVQTVSNFYIRRQLVHVYADAVPVAGSAPLLGPIICRAVPLELIICVSVSGRNFWR